MNQKDKKKLLWGIVTVVGGIITFYNLNALMQFIGSAIMAAVGVVVTVFGVAQFIEVNKK